jgi:hypothetical protein
MDTQKTSNQKISTRLLSDRNSVEAAYKDVLDKGYTQKDINLIMSDDTRKKHFSNLDKTETVIGDQSMDGLAMGGAIGGSVVGIAAAIAALGTALVIPGLNVVVAGPLAAGLAGAGAGGLAGGLIGALVGLGIPEERVKEYEAGIKKGGVLMTVNSKSDEDFKKLQSNWENSPKDRI